MAYTLTQALGIGAGLLVMGVGLFVVVARKDGWYGRLFFLLAWMDGLSTMLFAVSAGVAGPESTFYQALYWYAYIAFVALLIIFGLLFPLPWRSLALAGTLAGLVAVASLVALVAHALHHEWFWSATLEGDGSVTYAIEPLGNVVNGFFSVGVAVLVLKLTRDLVRPASASHRTQAAFVLGGMTLAYAPYPVGTLARVMSIRPDVLYAVRADRIFAYWAFVAVCAALVLSLVSLMRAGGLHAGAEGRFLLVAYFAVGLLAVLVWSVPTVELTRLLRIGALVVYPVLLAYAIARYEVFDIDRQLRRAATVTLAATALTASFVLAESTLENLLASSVFGGLPSAAVSGAIAAVVTAFAFVPVARASRKAAAKIVPELSHDELYQRKREIYLHSLAGAMADGILKEGESRTLAMLRESLGITDAEHRALLAQVRPARGPPAVTG